MAKTIEPGVIEARIKDRLADISYLAPGSSSKQVSKTIPVDTLCKILSDRARGEQELVIFPNGMRFHGRISGRVIVAFEDPELIRRINYRVGLSGGTSENVVWNCRLPMAMTIIEFVETNSKRLQFRRFYQFALKSPFFGLETPLFMWPFTNVYDDGSCCLGGINIPEYPSITETVSAVNLFHQGTYNNDMTNNRINTYNPPGGGVSITTPQALWRHLQDNDNPKAFPYSVLKPMTTVRTLLDRAGYRAIL